MSSQYSRTRLRTENPNDFSNQFSSEYYSPTNLINRLSLPAFVTALVIAATLAANALRAQALGRRIQSLPDLVWDCIVTLTPVFLIHAVDTWMNPPMFPGLPPASPPTTHAEKGEKMAALIGTNKAVGVLRSFSSGLPRPSFPTSPLRSGLLSSFSGSKDQPPGLGNFDNSCYQNSILQSLASLDHLPPYLNNHLRGNNGDGLETAKTLQDLISKLKESDNNGRTLWTPGVLKNMCSFMQQDAQEYYSKLLDEIDNEIIKAGGSSAGNSTDSVDSANDDTSLHSDDSGYSSSTSIASKLTAGKAPRNPLEGLLAQRVACVQCGYSEGLSLIPFNCLTINLGLNTPGHDLYERLDAYTNLEAIEGVECPQCTLLKLQRLLRTLADRFRQNKSEHLVHIEKRLEAVETALEEEAFDDVTMREKCKVTPESKVSVVKTKQAVVARPPKSLAIHVNRSVFDERTGMLFKNPAAVQFPTTLDLGPWCLGSRGAVPGMMGEVGGSGEEEEEWILEPKVSMVAGENGPSRISGPIYELRAVVTHYGHHNNGHYICYRKHAASEAPPILKEPKVDSGDDVDAEVEGEAEGQEEGDDEATWWRLSDETVRKVPEELVMAQGGVFMLFYDCVDEKLVRTDGGDEGVGREEETLVGAVDGSGAVSLDGSEALSSAETLRVDGGSSPDTLSSAETLRVDGGGSPDTLSSAETLRVDGGSSPQGSDSDAEASGVDSCPPEIRGRPGVNETFLEVDATLLDVAETSEVPETSLEASEDATAENHAPLHDVIGDSAGRVPVPTQTVPIQTGP